MMCDCEMKTQEECNKSCPFKNSESNEDYK